MNKGYFGCANLEEMIEDELWQDVDFYYNDKHYMLSAEWLGSRKHKEEKKCLSVIDPDQGNKLTLFQIFDTWEDLFETATMQDGKLIKEVIKNIL